VNPCGTDFGGPNDRGVAELNKSARLEGRMHRRELRLGGLGIAACVQREPISIGEPDLENVLRAYQRLLLAHFVTPFRAAEIERGKFPASKA
jgi:hypothetical protein